MVENCTILKIKHWPFELCALDGEGFKQTTEPQNPRMEQFLANHTRQSQSVPGNTSSFYWELATGREKISIIPVFSKEKVML